MSLKIDYSINNWLKDLALDKNKDYLNKLLNLGYQVSNISNISINPESTILEPITQKVLDINNNCNNTYREMLHSLDLYKTNTEYIKDRIKLLDTNISKNIESHSENNKIQYQNLADIIGKLTGDINTSSIKGKIGENFLENILTNSFPDDNVDVTASTGHEADMHLHSKDYPTILIESKLYKNPVTTKEVEKFYKDLETTGINYGLFVSLTSPIMCHRRLEYKEIKGKHVVFIPNSGFDNLNIIYGILFLRHIHLINSKNNNISVELIDEKCSIIYNSLGYLDKIYENINKMKNDTLKSKSIIDNQISNLISNVIESEIIVKDIINKIKKDISESLSELNNSYNVIEPEEIDIIINELMNSDNKLSICIGESLNYLKNNRYDICKDIENDSKYIILKNGSKYCDLKISKTKAIYDFINSGIKYEIKNNTDITKFEKIVECAY